VGIDRRSKTPEKERFYVNKTDKRHLARNKRSNRAFVGRPAVVPAKFVTDEWAVHFYTSYMLKIRTAPYPLSRRFVKAPAAPLLSLVLSFALAACGGSDAGSPSIATSVPSGPNATTVEQALSGGEVVASTAALKNDPSCAIQYSVNDAPEQVGPDPLLNNQWHLKNTGQRLGRVGEDINVEGAWKFTLGEGVRIALVDDALEVVHGDLKANIVAGASYNYRPAIKGSAFPLPCNKDDGHGTSVAGIIGSRAANGIGTSGIAPKAELVGYNALSLDLTLDIADALNRDLSKNSIYHNSWGSPDTGELNEAESEFTQAIARGTKEGRKGKGAIYVFPAGNGGCFELTGQSGCNKDNANFDGYINKLGIIAVGALDQFGKQPWYGEGGSNVLVSAPAGDSSAGITTTAINNSYRNDFIGTSASAPMVSGAVALMLSANPELTWRDVPIILAKSARRNDSGDSNWIGNFNHRYGFGALDTTAAVAMAKTWKTVGGTNELKKCTKTAAGTAGFIPDAGVEIGSTLSLQGCAISAIEYITVSVDVTHDYSGDLVIDLISPNGSKSNLATPRKCQDASRAADHCGSLQNWQFGSVRHLDENASGNWHVFIRDTVAGKVGTLSGWTITVYGR
jgi:proprotein convertase subtilisin/kexin type 2